MAVERAALAAFVDEIGRFYIRASKLRRAQTKMRAALASGKDPSERAVAAYLGAVHAYFAGFEREARAHLADVDKRLARVSQLQYNLTAERGVGARRVEVTQGVLTRLGELAPR